MGDMEARRRAERRLRKLREVGKVVAIIMLIAGITTAVTWLALWPTRQLKRDEEVRLNSRGSYTCYSDFKDAWDRYPDARLFIMKAKADGVFTNRECEALSQEIKNLEDRDLNKSSDELMESIGRDSKDRESSDDR